MLTSSCVKHRELVNFKSGEELVAFPITGTVTAPRLVVQADDLLSIKVTSLEMEAAAPYNIDPPNINPTNINTSENTRPFIGYLVDAEGNIDFPNIGKLKVAGLNTTEVQTLVIDALKPVLNVPTVVVRFLNFRVTVLGEVSSAGTFFFSNERVTLLDAIGRAGDLGPYANRTDVLVIRESNGNRESQRLSLKDQNIFNSPFFYLKQNDVIYIEPLPEKTASLQDQTQRILPWASVITGLVTLIITVASL